MKKKKRAKKNGCFFGIAWFVFLCLISVLMARFIMTGVNDMLAVGKSHEIVQVEFPDNASVNTVTEILSEKKLINEKWFFKIYTLAVKLPKSFAGGVYELEIGMDYQSILNHIKNHENVKDIVEITVTEGMNVLDCAELMKNFEVCDKEEFLKLCASDKFNEKYTFIGEGENVSNRIYKLEGYLFPDTYKFYRGESPFNVISKFLNNYQKKIYGKMQIEGYSSKTSFSEIAKKQNTAMNQIIIIASLIQSEAANKEDMHKISSVIYNRLATAQSGGKNRFGEFSMNILRLDATVYYPYKTKSAIPQSLLKGFNSSYNTYRIEGLPPGPICNPGIEAINAALSPEQTDYYYYCHSDSGEAFYARTNEVHLSNLRKAGIA